MAAMSVCDFLAHSEVEVLGKVLMKMLVCSVEIISRLDSQSKFQSLHYFQAAMLVYRGGTSTRQL